MELFQTVPSFLQHLIYIIRFTYKRKANQLQMSNARITLKNAFNGFLTPYKSAERLGGGEKLNFFLSLKLANLFDP